MEPATQPVPIAAKLKPFLEYNPGPGRPSLVSEEIAQNIIKHLLAGAYWDQACEASGVAYETVRRWIKRAQHDREQGKEDSEYVLFCASLSRACAASEVGKVHRLNEHEDWRAQAFLLERGPGRERWGKPENVQAAQTIINLPESVGTALVEALRLAAAQPVIDITPASATTDSAK